MHSSRFAASYLIFTSFFVILRHNFCGKPHILYRMKFKRKKYLDKLIAGRGNGLVKIVTGVRRCGKSFLLFNIFVEWLKENGVTDDHIIGIQFDDFIHRKLRDPEALLDYIDSQLQRDGTSSYIILDEIQLVDNFVEVMLSLMHLPQVEIYVSGSNSKFLSSDIVTEFRGRGQEIRVMPLSLPEYMEGTGKDYRDAIQEYFVYGGLPQVAILSSYEEKEVFLREMYELTYLRDVEERNHLRNADGLRELIRVLASGIGASTNPKRISDTFGSVAGIKLTYKSIKEYISYLCDSFLIEEALRYDVKGRKYIGTETKYYFEDLGIRNVVLNFRQIEESHLMENLIYNELRGRGYLVDIGLVGCWGRNSEGKTMRKNLEVDFVVNRGSKRVYIQSAYAMPSKEKVEQEERSLINIGDSFQKIVLVYDNIIMRRNESGIVTMSLRDFLLREDLLESLA